MNKLRIENLSHSYTDGDTTRIILEDLNYEFESGKVYTITGKSGSGKTTLLSLMSGLDTPVSGNIYLNDSKINDKSLRYYRKEDISIVFQEYNLINYLTALENVVLAMEISGDLSDRYNIAKEKLRSLGIDDTKMNRITSKLSGGEQQRVAIARTVATNPSIIFADEPTGNLDNKTEKEIISIFKNLAHKEDKCVIIVTHSSSVAKSSDVSLRINNGMMKETK